MEQGPEFTGSDKEIEDLLISMGYGVSDYSVRKVRKNVHVHVVIYKPEGVSINDCAEVYRTLLPKLEIIQDTRDIHLEVSSPGISRTIKNLRELGLYQGRGVSILVNGSWIGGILDTVAPQITLTTSKGCVSCTADEIQKAKLDYTQEVVE